MNPKSNNLEAHKNVIRLDLSVDSFEDLIESQDDDGEYSVANVCTCVSMYQAVKVPCTRQ